jgi:hypothetical protein
LKHYNNHTWVSFYTEENNTLNPCGGFGVQFTLGNFLLNGQWCNYNGSIPINGPGHNFIIVEDDENSWFFDIEQDDNLDGIPDDEENGNQGDDDDDDD